jgi:hypothetical protein
MTEASAEEEPARGSFSERYARGGRASRRFKIVTITIAVTFHVGLLAWFGWQRLGREGGRPPEVTGFNEGHQVSLGGMPMKKGLGNLHEFVIKDEESGAPVARAVVRDLLGGGEEITDDTGYVQLAVHPAAKFIVQVERPGYAIYARELQNTDSAAPLRKIFLKHAAVPYAIVDTLLIQRCQFCHGSPGHVEGTDFTSYDKLMGSTSRHGIVVWPYFPDSSRIVRALTDTLGADGKRAAHFRQTAAPPGLELDYLREWIRQGARRTPAPQR